MVFIFLAYFTLYKSTTKKKKGNIFIKGTRGDELEIWY